MTLQKIGLDEDKLRYLGAYYSNTFTESDVTVTENGAVATGGSIRLQNGLFLNAEDGTINPQSDFWTDWTGDISTLSAQQSTVISGSFSLESTVSSQNIYSSNRNVASNPNEISFAVQLDTQTGSINDRFRIVFHDAPDGGGDSFGVSFFGDGVIENLNYTNLGSWSIDTTYIVRIYNIDWNNNIYDIDINGTTKATDENMATSVSQLKSIEILHTQNSTTSAYLDDFSTAEQITTGNALIGTTNGIPQALSTWEDIYFQSDPDGETLTVDIEDSNGNVLISDVSSGDDLSSISSSKEVKIRVNLSRNNVTNNPALNQIEWWWLRKNLV